MDRMCVTILGSGTAVPLAGRGAAGYLVRSSTVTLLMDAGPGTLARLAQFGLSHKDIDLLLVSHLHPDHTLDLVTLLLANNAVAGCGRSRPLTLIGCRGLAALLDRLKEAYDGIEPEGYALEVREIGAGSLELAGGLRLTSAHTGHTGTSLAFRLECQGRSMVYSGDASPAGGLEALAREADLFLCECSLPDGMAVPDHLCPAEVGRIARAAQVGRVVLTHFYPPVLQAGGPREEVEGLYGGPVSLGYDGWTAWV